MVLARQGFEFIYQTVHCCEETKINSKLQAQPVGRRLTLTRFSGRLPRIESICSIPD